MTSLCYLKMIIDKNQFLFVSMSYVTDRCDWISGSSALFPFDS